MRIWIARHGQTNLNKKKLMQGRTDEPLNETGIAQAKARRAQIGDVHFDAVYASPLKRAVKTASILGNVPEEEVIIDERVIEVDFGKYELKHYALLGPKMTFYWLLPEVLPAPKTVEPVSAMVERTSEFLKELEQKGYEDVLVTCHGGIMRALSGYLTDSKNGIMWRPKPENTEIRVFEVHEDGTHSMIGDYK